MAANITYVQLVGPKLKTKPNRHQYFISCKDTAETIRHDCLTTW